MTLPRRRLLAAAAATALAAPWIGGTARAQTKQLKISHQFPGGTVDRAAISATSCAAASPPSSRSETNGALNAEVYPGSSLVKTVRAVLGDPPGALDMSLYPLSTPAARSPSTNIGLMPGAGQPLRARRYAWKKAEIGKR